MVEVFIGWRSSQGLYIEDGNASIAIEETSEDIERRQDSDGGPMGSYGRF
jgi:hypothetical protein